ncbi:MAG TPA: AAA family ATPase [Gemmatimonadaceae bacterium]|nr:AAA family ATPase [Gemmatimonadaceae bacterium]
MPLDRVLATLTGVKQHGESWTARCPAHDDGSPSLSISVGKDGRVLLNCHAGCTLSAILEAIGLQTRDLFPDDDRGGRAPAAPLAPNGNAPPRIVDLYEYVDEDEQLLYQVVRYEPKGFRQRRPDPARDAEWIWSLGETRRVLYHLPRLIEAIAKEQRVYIVEGEKDVHALEGIGLTATTNAGGAAKWSDRYSQVFAGADVVILPDNDAPGLAHAAIVANSLRAAHARTVRIVTLPDLPPKGDVSDFLWRGGTRERLEQLVEDAPVDAPLDVPRRMRFTLGELLADPALLKPPEMIIARLVARHRSTLLYAAEKVGKSTLAAYTLAAKSRGGLIFGARAEAGTVLLVALEEFQGDVVRRLAHFNGDGTRLHIVMALEGITIEARLAEIRQHIRETGADYVVIDTLIALVAGKVESTNSDGDMQPVVQGLSDIAHTMGCGMLLVAHATKGGGSWRGSGAIGGSVDVLAELTVPEADDEQTTRIVRVRGRIPFEDFRIRYTGSSFDVVDVLGDLESQILGVIATSPGCSGAAIRGAVTGKATLIDRAITRLVERHAIVDRGSERHHTYYLAETLTPSHDGTGGTGLDLVTSSPALPRPRPGGTGPGQGADGPRDGLIPSNGQRTGAPDEPLQGVHRGPSSPETAMAHAS